MASLQELSDRLEINDVLVRYCHAIDSKQFDELDEVFAPDASIDYTTFGGPRGSLAEVKAFLADGLGGYPAYQHLIANSAVELHGDTATGRTMCHNPMVMPPGDGPEHLLIVGLWYVDAFARTGAGWRITARSEELSFARMMRSTPLG